MQQPAPKSILLGGIGGDSHSVGLHMLRHALFRNGYRVLYLGTQNPLEEFFRLAGLSNVVMISDMDGHAKHYLREFPELMKQYQAHRPPWYLGGNLTIGDGGGYEEYFTELGFRRVFVKYVNIRTVLDCLEKDLYDAEPVPRVDALWEGMRPKSTHLIASLSDAVIEPDIFKRERSEVLQLWKTGYAVRDLDENAEFLARQPSFPAAEAMVTAGRTPILIQPRAGVPSVSEQTQLFRVFKSLGLRVLSYQVDSLTRNSDYASAAEAILESQQLGRATLNGFPVINHGVPHLRRIISEIKVPLQTRHSARDPRLLAEISYAGGVTAFEGGAICYNVPYYKDYLLEQSINTWQYVDRLTGLYYDKYGVIIDREFFGPLTGTLIPPCLAIASNILEAILAVQQGVTCVSLAYGEQGNRSQDIAAIRTMPEMATEYLSNLGYKNVQVSTVFHQYMAAFPQSADKAAELVHNSAATGALAGATRMVTKTPVEAFKIPSLEDNVQGLKLAMRGISASLEQQTDEMRIAQERQIIQREVQAILDSVIFCGGGSVAHGISEGFRRGYLDIPFAPSLHNKGDVITARDVDGSVRFLRAGNLQLDRELKEFHEHKMQERLHSEGLRSADEDYLVVEKDLLQVSLGQYETWPLSN